MVGVEDATSPSAATIEPLPLPPQSSSQPLQNSTCQSNTIKGLTRMRREAWEDWLNRPARGSTDPSTSFASTHPELYHQIIDGITNGVRVNYSGSRTAPRTAHNPPVDDEEAIAKMDKVIAEDVASGKKAGPFDEPPMLSFCVSPISPVAKRNSHKIRVIHNLSYPFRGDSINSNITEPPLPMAGFNLAAIAVRELGPGCFLIKLDVEAAYKQVPVHPDDWHLLGFKWKGKYYYERVLPFGMRSSCRLWEMFATALHFLVEHILELPAPTGVHDTRLRIIHYVDDFLFVVRDGQFARSVLPRILTLCETLGIPMAKNKVEGPTTRLTFLGIELDTVAMQARLDEQRLTDLQQLCRMWASGPHSPMGIRHATIKDLQSLTGTLNFACNVVRPGRFFLRRIINFTTRIQQVASRGNQRFTVPNEIRLDMQWWNEYIQRWNGISLLYEEEWSHAGDMELYTDACLTGYGARYRSHWIAGSWDRATLRSAFRQKRISMPHLELYAIALAAQTWGHLWRQKKIVFRCDCDSVVKALRGRKSSKALAHLLRILTAAACEHNFDYRAIHIPGVQNTVADLLSRSGMCDTVRQLMGQSDPESFPHKLLPHPPPSEK